MRKLPQDGEELPEIIRKRRGTQGLFALARLEKLKFTGLQVEYSEGSSYISSGEQ